MKDNSVIVRSQEDCQELDVLSVIPLRKLSVKQGNCEATNSLQHTWDTKFQVTWKWTAVVRSGPMGQSAPLGEKG